MTKRKITDHIVVHHSATNRDTTTFKSIKRYHMEERDWDNVGYHKVITGDGHIHDGMPDEYEGYHALYGGFNQKSVAVCLTGNFQEEYPTNAQLVSLEEVLGGWRDRYDLPREAIIGHRETGFATACPGDHLAVWLKAYRRINDSDGLLKKVTEELRQCTVATETQKEALERSAKEALERIKELEVVRRNYAEAYALAEKWEKKVDESSIKADTLTAQRDDAMDKLTECIEELAEVRRLVREDFTFTEIIQLLIKKLRGGGANESTKSKSETNE